VWSLPARECSSFCLANDGVAGEGDNVHGDIEDVIVGSWRDNRLWGHDGDDVLTGKKAR
jgi:hypothetical protein